MYYGGMALIAIGLLLFVSGFFTGPNVQEGFDQFSRDARAVMERALLGMGLCVVGGILMNIGARGAAGSGLVLDPEKARQDLEPWSRMGGGVVEDALSEVNVVKKLEEGIGNLQPQVKVRCRKCQALNDETAKFCDQCGAPM